jgi:hypothetical protein
VERELLDRATVDAAFADAEESVPFNHGMVADGFLPVPETMPLVAGL